MDSSWQMSFYIDELLTATKNEPLIKTHVRTSTLPRQELEIKGNLSFKFPKSVLGKAMENMTPGTILALNPVIYDLFHHLLLNYVN